MKANRLVILIVLTTGILGVYGQNTRAPQQDWSKGPLVGKNWYLPFAIYYQYPGYRARSGDQSELQYHVGQYYTNDFYSIFSSSYQNSLTKCQPEAYPATIYVGLPENQINLDTI